MARFGPQLRKKPSKIPLPDPPSAPVAEVGVDPFTDPFMSQDKIARALGVSEPTVRREIAQ